MLNEKWMIHAPYGSTTLSYYYDDYGEALLSIKARLERSYRNKWMSKETFESEMVEIVSQITKEDITDFLNTEIKQSPINRFNYIKDLSIFFNWAVTEKYAHENPLATIKRPVVDRNDPPTLTLQQCKDLILNTSDADRAYVLVALGAGVRPAEADAMDWSMISLEPGRIRLPAAVTKTRMVRSITTSVTPWLRTPRHYGIFTHSQAA